MEDRCGGDEYYEGYGDSAYMYTLYPFSIVKVENSPYLVHEVFLSKRD